MRVISVRSSWRRAPPRIDDATAVGEAGGRTSGNTGAQAIRILADDRGRSPLPADAQRTDHIKCYEVGMHRHAIEPIRGRG